MKQKAPAAGESGRGSGDKVMANWEKLGDLDNKAQRQEIVVELLLSEIQRLRGIINRVISRDLVLDESGRLTKPMKKPEFVCQSESQTGARMPGQEQYDTYLRRQEEARR